MGLHSFCGGGTVAVRTASGGRVRKQVGATMRASFPFVLVGEVLKKLRDGFFFLVGMRFGRVEESVAADEGVPVADMKACFVAGVERIILTSMLLMTVRSPLMLDWEGIAARTLVV
jgi:hypothetical protein